MSLQTSFSQGAMWMAEVDTVIGGTPDNGSRMLGLLQDNSVDLEYTSKEAYGQAQFPAVIARGQGKITGKSTFLGLDSTLIAQSFFGLPVATGEFAVAQSEPDTVPSTTPFTIAVANASSFVFDLGVIYASGSIAGQSLTRVTTPSAAGQYSVNFSTGVYTFSSADSGQAVLISYHYSLASAGKIITITNQLQGFTPYFRAVMFNEISPSPPPASAVAAPFALCLNACTASKLSIPRKIQGFTEIQIDWAAFADATGTIGYWSTLQ